MGVRMGVRIAQFKIAAIMYTKRTLQKRRRKDNAVSAL